MQRLGLILTLILSSQVLLGQRASGYIGGKNLFLYAYSPGYDGIGYIGGDEMRYTETHAFSYRRVLTDRVSIGFEHTKYYYNTPFILTPYQETDFKNVFTFQSNAILLTYYRMKKGSLAPIGKYFELAPQMTKGIKSDKYKIADFLSNMDPRWKFGFYMRSGIRRGIGENIILDLSLKYGYTFARSGDARYYDNWRNALTDFKYNSVLRVSIGLGFTI